MTPVIYVVFRTFPSTINMEDSDLVSGGVIVRIRHSVEAWSDQKRAYARVEELTAAVREWVRLSSEPRENRGKYSGWRSSAVLHDIRVRVKESGLDEESEYGVETVELRS